MLEAQKGLSQLLHDAVATAEAAQADREVLLHLRNARALFGLNASGTGIRIDVLSGSAYAALERIELSPSEAAFVIALGLAGGISQREVLADQIYGDAEPRDAANALKVVAHRVRRRVGSNDAVRYDAGRYSLAPWIRVDLPFGELPTICFDEQQPLAATERAELESLRDRLAAGRPDFMLGWTWFEDTERRLRDLERDVAITLARDAVCGGRYGTARRLANRLLHDDPLDESAADVILRAFAATGDRTGAAGYYRRYEARVLRQTGSLPNDDLRRAFITIAATTSAAR